MTIQLKKFWTTNSSRYLWRTSTNVHNLFIVLKTVKLPTKTMQYIPLHLQHAMVLLASWGSQKFRFSKIWKKCSQNVSNLNILHATLLSLTHLPILLTYYSPTCHFRFSLITQLTSWQLACLRARVHANKRRTFWAIIVTVSQIYSKQGLTCC